jgi:hypothetical protein
MKRGHTRTVACWLPVLGIALALLLAPSSSNGAASDTSLRVTPGSGSYGGQRVTWTGSVGVAGVQQVHLQRRGNPTAAWADVRESTFRTAADGSFSFDFPAPAMNGVYFRVVGETGATPAYLFKTVQQDADVSVTEATPLPSDVALPRGFAVIGEPFSIAVDTARGAAGQTKPVLVGRRATLQFRGDGGWEDLAAGALTTDGTVTFGPYGPGAAPQVAGFYRVVLADWTEDGDRVGWIPSLPLYLRLVHRPQPVATLVAVPTAHDVKLTWSLPVDPERAQIVVARRKGRDSEDPTAAKPANIVATLPGTAGVFVDSDVDAQATYKYAVYTVSADGVYSAVPARVETLTPKAG